MTARSFVGVLALGLLAALALSAQAPVAVAASSLSSSAVPASYIVGPNDVLAMSVFGDQELDASGLRVDADGTISIPYGSAPVHVAGLTTDAIGRAIAAALVRDQLAVSPRVSVTVVAAESHAVVFTGQGLRAPGTIQAIRPVHLLDALAQVGGVNGQSASEITIVRPAADGKTSEQHLTVAQVFASTTDASNPLLYGGEQVRVLPVADVYLTGGVTTPGAYPLSDSDPLTVRKIMAKAHGLATAAKPDKAELFHNAGQPNQTMTVINLSKIMAGKLPDLQLAANDMLYVPVSGAKKNLLDFGTHTVTVLTVAAGTILAK